MRTLNIDVETFSTQAIKLGVTKYTTGAELLLLAYSLEGASVRVIDIAQGEEIPSEFTDALWDASVIKKAWNAAFEIEQLEKYFNKPMKLNQWQCTMIRSARCGFPMKLETAAQVMGVSQKKDTVGKFLIGKFSVPKKPSKASPSTRNYPTDLPDLWEKFKEYNAQDVRVEMACDKYLSRFPDTTDFEKTMYVLDRTINKRGLEIDLDFVQKAIDMDKAYKVGVAKEFAKLTGVANAKSLPSVKAWMLEHTGLLWKSLDKEAISDALDRGVVREAVVKTYPKGSPQYIEHFKDKKTAKKEGFKFPESIDLEVYTGRLLPIEVTPFLKKVLTLKSEISNTSVAKFVAMKNAAIGSRIHDTIQFYGASRTGRNAGRIIQPQNMPRVYMSDKELDVARKLVSTGSLPAVEMCFNSVSSTLSQLIRTAIISKKGLHLKVVDLSAIEARVLAWLAGEGWVLDVFKTHGKIYEATASLMFKVPMESITKDSEYRKRGKAADLGCGFGGSVGAITKMDSDKKIPDEAKPGLVKAWRDARPKTVAFWYASQRAAIKAIKNPGEKVPLAKGIYFQVVSGALLAYLPSGRYLSYPKVGLEEGQYGESIFFYGLGQTDATKDIWMKNETYYGRIVENLVQAIARDILMVGMLNMTRAGYTMVFSVHDETVSETAKDFGSLKEIEKLMCNMPSWADGLPLGAEGFESDYYKK